MNLLMSAYACEPNKGSEPEVGWRWMIESSKKFNEVVLVTRANNRDSIECEFKKLNINNVKFEYFDLPKWISFWKKGGRGVQLYAYLWECFLFFFLLKKFHKNNFDVVHRVTFVTYRFPSFLWYFGKKFIFGPIAGGERFPRDFLKIFTFKGKIKEVVRMIIQRVSLLDPFVLLTLYKADEIIAVTHDTKTILPKFVQMKARIKPAISISLDDFNVDLSKKRMKKNGDILKLLYIGRLIEWKGLMLSFEALSGIDESKYEFNVIGSGSDEKVFIDYVKRNNLNVNFLGQIDREKLSEYYLSHDLFVFPSLHDSGGMVVLEAKAHGLPVIVSDFGGPKMFVGEKDTIIKSRTAVDFIAKLNDIILIKIEDVDE
ncbi:MAG: glycosyltransferase family 4 protein [Sulfuricurvum sp.]|nr:glycosyltransferase family 4 protein [Sulfuricurvum sp.]